MEIIGALLGMIVGIAIIATIIAAFFMWVGAKVAGVRNATFFKSIIAALGSAFITWFVSFVFSVVPVFGTILGFMIGLFFAILVIKASYSTSFGKALLVWIF
ncbi:MAG: hypothetical protein KAR45_12540, partial [Desulfobacteraceae bacterium]|nr:hypothetical protein [Desulfobacteraceae bacterium]